MDAFLSPSPVRTPPPYRALHFSNVNSHETPPVRSVGPKVLTVTRPSRLARPSVVRFDASVESHCDDLDESMRESVHADTNPTGHAAAVETAHASTSTPLQQRFLGAKSLFLIIIFKYELLYINCRDVGASEAVPDWIPSCVPLSACGHCILRCRFPSICTDIC